ncbi:alanine racemase [Thermomicrobium sp. 4228-Ro]|uniref:alanine racemase n=1 Tax=Thermomicrobium sp. 4228-Ro TaxID=2993937 RepID=UPI00224981C8|nr:alanine racemase [Thermomicrobium sp. 4228-Ro]MCX2728156.1 alanine racemase [Thermomicrobium sp. 4228-Ro]
MGIADRTAPDRSPACSSGWCDRLRAAYSALHAAVDLDQLAANARALLRTLPPDVELLAVLKANAYGHGLVPTARAALAGGARWLGVARIEEGLVLRQAGITAPVVVLGPPNAGRLREAIAADITLAVGSLADLLAVRRAASALGRRARVHLEVDTGMHRFGADPAEAIALARALRSDPALEFEGIYTHFATADAPDCRTLRLQLARFRAVRERLVAEGLHPPVVHQANSAATLRGAIGDPDLPGRRVVRAGIAFYGLTPDPAMSLPAGVRPALQLRARLTRCFTVDAGEGISYGHTYVTDRPTRCGLVPVGYADGLPRALSNRGWFLVHGIRCPIRGRVCMDQTIISLEDVPQAQLGDPVIVLGDPASGAMTAWEAAELSGTIAYEILTSLAARIPRVYVRGGEPVALADSFGLLERDVAVTE